MVIELPLVHDVIDCDGCGACCTEQAGLPVTWYTAIEPDAQLPRDLREWVGETLRRWTAGGAWSGPGDRDPCVWYDEGTRRCRHYEWRPEVCREFEVGSEECLEWRKDKGIKP